MDEKTKKQLMEEAESIKKEIQNKKEDIEEIKTQMDDLTNDFIDQYGDQLTTEKYIDDLVNEFCDSSIDIYYSDLDKWAAGNSGYIDDAVREGFVDVTHFDYYKAIQSGQFLAFRETIDNDNDLIIDIIEDLKEIEELEAKLDDLDEELTKGGVKNE